MTGIPEQGSCKFLGQSMGVPAGADITLQQFQKGSDRWIVVLCSSPLTETDPFLLTGMDPASAQ